MKTVVEVWDRLSKIGANLFSKTLKQIEDGTVKRIPQNNRRQGEPTYAPMLNKSMAEIDWKNKTAQEIKNLVRGLNGIMGAYTIINDKKYKLLKVQVIDNQEFLNRFNCDNGMLNNKETKR